MNSSFALFLAILSNAHAFSEQAQLTRGRLYEALRSPSGKLTYSPEIIIPEPSDPTSLLLQGNEVKKISEKLRTSGKINTAFLSGSLSSLNNFISEQEEARGSFPGPVPAIYCALSGLDENDSETLETLAEYGCSGVVTSVCSGRAISSVDDLREENEDWMKKALSFGVQPIPEIILNMEKTWDVDSISSIINVLKEKCENEDGPVAVVLSLESGADNNSATESSDDKSDPDEFWNNVPNFPKSFSKETPVLGSIRVDSLDSLTDYSANLKTKGFTGAFLRADCVPGFRMNPDLDFVGGFWSAVVAKLKSTKSSTFEFRTKTKLEKDIPMEWMNYQKDVMESGALGAPSSKTSVDDLDEARGDFKGFK